MTNVDAIRVSRNELADSGGGNQMASKAPIAALNDNGCELSLSCLENSSEIASHKQDWLALEAVSKEGFDYFQTFDWCAGWCSKFAKGETDDSTSVPQVYVLKVDGQVALIWPLMKVQARSGLAFLESLTEPLGQYANVLFNPKLVDFGIGRWVWENIKSNCGVDAISLNHYPESSFIADVIGNEGVDETIQYVSSVFDFSLIQNWEAYIASLNKNQRKQRGRRVRKLEALGELKFEVYFKENDEYRQLVDQAIEMKRLWLIETNRHSQSLFEDASKLFLSGLGGEGSSFESGEGPVVQVVKLDGKPIAIEIGMLRDGHYYSYLGAIDLEYSSYSPGKVQMEMTQKWAYDYGIRMFDFLSDPSDYKKSWTNMQAAMFTRYFPVTHRGHIYCVVWKAQLKPFLRNLYQRSNPKLRKQVNKLLGLDQDAA
ncbi:MAG: GNAT family N-acetyltransferase [Rhizobiaceae bacterium]